MMPLKYLTLALLLITVACDNKTKDGFQISGKLSNVESGSPVYLDAMSYDKINPIDTTIVESDGTYKLYGTTKEETLYRMRFGDGKYVLLILDEKTNDVQLDADTANVFKKPYVVKGSPQSVSLQNLLSDVNKRNERLGEMVQAASDTTTSDSLQQANFEAYQAGAMETRTYVLAYADTVNSPVIAVFAAANFLNPQTDLQEANALANKLTKKFPNNSLVASFKNALQPQQQSQPESQEDPYAPKQNFESGAPLPDIEAASPNGKAISLSSLRGKYVLVDFWASWCKPCRAENPNVVAAYNKYKDKGFTIYSYSLDEDKSRWVDAIKEDKLSWNAHVSDLKGWKSEAVSKYGIVSIPTNYLLDRKGNVIAFNLRGEELDMLLNSLFTAAE